jgi:hypothetical protein
VAAEPYYFGVPSFDEPCRRNLQGLKLWSSSTVFITLGSLKKASDRILLKNVGVLNSAFAVGGGYSA